MPDMKYIGLKVITAIVMFLLDAESLLNRSVGYEGTLDEHGNAEGYLVTYPDGYQSWSPKEVFEQSYTPLPDTLHEGMIEYEIKEGDVVEFDFIPLEVPQP